MDKKYQVFISSTFKDMKDERQAAVQAILDAGHIPAGMELFAASDKKQIEVIKLWIDRSDIFMLILGGRYGTVEAESGKSYIQLEYEYAIETGKPLFALYLTDEAIDQKVKRHGLDVAEQDDTKSFKEFRANVMGKMCRAVDESKDIFIEVPKAIRDLAEVYRLEGWVRASRVVDTEPYSEEIMRLKDEIAVLKIDGDKACSEKKRFAMQGERIEKKKLYLNEMDALSAVGFADGFQESRLDVHLDLNIAVSGAKGDIQNVRWTGTYLDLFAKISGTLVSNPTDEHVRRLIFGLVREHADVVGVVEGRSYVRMMAKFVELGVIEPPAGDRRWKLTPNGKALFAKLYVKNGRELFTRIFGQE